MATTTTTPTQIPALKMPPITWQPANVDSKNKSVTGIAYFIVIFF